MAIRLGIIGAAGRMGRRIAALACEDERFAVCCGLEKEGHPGLGVDLGELIGQGRLSLPISSSWSEVPEVVINFSAPAGTVPFGLTLDSRALRIDIPAWKLEVSRVLRVRF